MSIVYNQKKASDLVVSGRHMREAWIDGQKIWPDRFSIDHFFNSLNFQWMGYGNLYYNADGNYIYYTSDGAILYYDKADHQWKPQSGINLTITPRKRVPYSHKGFVIIMDPIEFSTYNTDLMLKEDSLRCSFYYSEFGDVWEYITVRGSGIEQFGFLNAENRLNDVIYDGKDLYLWMGGKASLDGHTAHGTNIIAVVPNFGSGNRIVGAVKQRHAEVPFYLNGIGCYDEEEDVFASIQQDLTYTVRNFQDGDLFKASYLNNQIFYRMTIWKDQRNDYLFLLKEDYTYAEIATFKDGFGGFPSMLTYDPERGFYVLFETGVFRVSYDLINWKNVQNNFTAPDGLYYIPKDGYYVVVKDSSKGACSIFHAAV